MNWNWYSLRRMRGALILILLGVVFFLQESDWFHWDVWPLFLVGLGIILLAERLLPVPPPPPPMPNPYAPYQQYPGAYGYQQQPPQPAAQPAPQPENPPSTGRTGNWS
jgi:hypothetical protein